VFVHDIVGGENHQVYQTLAAENLDRQYAFLKSVVDASIALQRPLLSTEVILSLNYHAISCLHAYAGEFRPCPVTVGARTPPPHFQVPGLMSMFVDEVNRNWDAIDPVVLAALVLWRINYVHPFVNGNGRTARAACLYVLCLKSGGWLPGQPILPELLRANRPAYVAALQHAHTTYEAGNLDLSLLHALLAQLINQQLAAANPQPASAQNSSPQSTQAAPATAVPAATAQTASAQTTPPAATTNPSPAATQGGGTQQQYWGRTVRRC
jgi:Fic family protein